MNSEKKQKIWIPLTAALLFIGLVLCLYAAAGSDAPWTHCPYDSYTLQAMAWRRGETKLDKNYPYLELAIINREYFAEHDRNDYQAYREVFGDINAPIEDQEGNEYYVSFPPFPSVPMLLLSFFFGENTPNTFMCILYTAGAFLFAILIGRRFWFSYPVSISGAAFLCIASSALFICTNKVAGGVWFQAQALSLLLTTGAFYFALGARDRDFYIACILLACAVGCRPFQLIYFIPLAFLISKKYHFKILKTWKFYVAPAGIGSVYLWYNWIRFGDPLEFGHNYLPEFMRMPAGQFGWEYFLNNLKNAFSEFPYFTQEGLQFNAFGFAFYVANVIFILVCAALMVRSLLPRGSRTFSAEIALLLSMLAAHLVLFLLHKTLGGWQFGSRYTVDMVPAALMLVCMAAAPLLSPSGIKNSSVKFLRPVFCGLSVLLLLFGGILNMYGSVKMF